MNNPAICTWDVGPQGLFSTVWSRFLVVRIVKSGASGVNWTGARDATPHCTGAQDCTELPSPNVTIAEVGKSL